MCSCNEHNDPTFQCPHYRPYGNAPIPTALNAHVTKVKPETFGTYENDPNSWQKKMVAIPRGKEGGLPLALRDHGVPIPIPKWKVIVPGTKKKGEDLKFFMCPAWTWSAALRKNGGPYPIPPVSLLEMSGSERLETEFKMVDRRGVAKTTTDSEQQLQENKRIRGAASHSLLR
jgi:hypothetical protein